MNPTTYMIESREYNERLAREEKKFTRLYKKKQEQILNEIKVFLKDNYEIKIDEPNMHLLTFRIKDKSSSFFFKIIFIFTKEKGWIISLKKNEDKSEFVTEHELFYFLSEL